MSRRAILWLAVALVIALGAAGAAIGWIVIHGVSARDEPTVVETLLARRLRHLAIPAADRALPNPLAVSEEALRSGREHFADHCAICHANNGSGETSLNQGLYPRAPDMRRSGTQDLSDGEIYWIIRNGIRLSGMPGWGGGTAHEDEETWGLVHFIRHLPALTDRERIEMEWLNPKSPGEIEAERAEQEFLSGGSDPGDKHHEH